MSSLRVPLADRKSDPESRALTIRGGRQMTLVCFDDRAADSQSHTHSLLLGGEKWLERLLDAFHPLPLIADFYDNVDSIPSRANRQHSRAFAHRFHGIDAILQQIDDHLSDLDRIPKR